MRFVRQVILPLLFVCQFAHASSRLFQIPNLDLLNAALNRQEVNGVKGTTYDSAAWTGIAGVGTRSYSWSTRGFKKINLSWPSWEQRAPYYRGNLPAYYLAPASKKSATSPELFIILGTSFGEIKRGIWYRQILDHLKRWYPNSAFLFFPGYLSDENILAAQPSFADAGVRYVGFDYYRRIQTFIKQKESEGVSYSRVGLIGMSGGASILLRILQEEKYDRSANSPRAKKLFNWGNLALSPVLSAKAAAEVVDPQSDYIEKNAIVRMGEFAHKWLVGKVLLGLLPWKPKADVQWLLGLSKTPESSDYQKLRHLVTISTAQEIKRFSEKQSPDYRGPYRLKEYYEDYSYPKLESLMGQKPQGSFEAFSSFFDSARSIDQPLKLVFSLDDVVLSAKSYFDPSARPHPEIIRSLASFRRNPHVQVETLRWGSHLGYFVDNEYMQALVPSSFR